MATGDTNPYQRFRANFWSGKKSFTSGATLHLKWESLVKGTYHD